MTEAQTRPHDWRPDRFMVIAAHPDDADFGPAATCARWIDQGSEGWLVCCTSGDAGASYADAGTPGNVSNPDVVGFGGWQAFKFVFAGSNLAGENRIYAVPA